MLEALATTKPSLFSTHFSIQWDNVFGFYPSLPGSPRDSMNQNFFILCRILSFFFWTNHVVNRKRLQNDNSNKWTTRHMLNRRPPPGRWLTHLLSLPHFYQTKNDLLHLDGGLLDFENFTNATSAV